MTPSNNASLNAPPGGAPPVLRTRLELRQLIGQWRREGHTIALVPTMGALHEGHLTLVRTALAECRRVIISIFVNPAQFGPNEDLAAYPRREAQDIAALSTLGGSQALAVWAPAVAEMYAPGFATTIAVGGLTRHLCGPSRPGHFEGVATVVAKLLNQVQPDRAYFGEKDFQQLQVIRRMASDLDIPVEIIGVPTIREADGLALSSRNAYLSPDQRARAALLPAVLNDIADAALGGARPLSALLDEGCKRLAAGGFDPIDYLAICDAGTLQPVDELKYPARIFVAAKMGKTRLIDNKPIGGNKAVR